MNIRRPPLVRALLLSVVAIATAVAGITILHGPIRLTVDRDVVFSSSGMLRPVGVVALFGILSGDYRLTGRIVLGLIVAMVLPLQRCRDTLTQLAIEQHPMKTASECVVRVEASAGVPPGLYLDERYVSHPLYYYFRRVRPVVRTDSPDFAAVERYLSNPSEGRPVLLWDSAYQEFMNARAAAGPRPASPPLIAFTDNVLLLPGPYEQCSGLSHDGAR